MMGPDSLRKKYERLQQEGLVGQSLPEPSLDMRLKEIAIAYPCTYQDVKRVYGLVEERGIADPVHVTRLMIAIAVRFPPVDIAALLDFAVAAENAPDQLATGGPVPDHELCNDPTCKRCT